MKPREYELDLDGALAAVYKVAPQPGYHGAFTRATAPGYLPNGTRVRKIAEDPGGDLTPLGTIGTVLGSMMHPSVGGGYFIEWDNAPKRAVFAIRWKVEPA